MEKQEEIIIEFKNNVIEDLISTYGCSKIEAMYLFKKSFVPNLIKEVPEMVLHDGVEYWSRLIYNWKEDI